MPEHCEVRSVPDSICHYNTVNTARSVSSCPSLSLHCSTLRQFLTVVHPCSAVCQFLSLSVPTLQYVTLVLNFCTPLQCSQFLSLSVPTLQYVPLVLNFCISLQCNLLVPVPLYPHTAANSVSSQISTFPYCNIFTQSMTHRLILHSHFTCILLTNPHPHNELYALHPPCTVQSTSNPACFTFHCQFTAYDVHYS